jgi:hypothetical protein
MPSSRPSIIPSVIHWVLQLRPQSILDVGMGFGKWGHLFREYTDIVQAAHDTARYQRANWKVRIDGIEGHAAYLTEMHRYLYNNVYAGDAAQILPTLPSYDLIFFGDIIEHFTKEDGLQLLRTAIAKSNQAVILSTPKFDTAQGACFDNELERHRSVWSAGDFQSFPGAIVKTIDGDMLVAVILKPEALAELRRRLRRPFLRKLMPSSFIDTLLWGRPR